MTIKNNFFQKRRSVMANKMDSSPIDKKDIDTILAAGIRVPDHGALSPWKLITIQGQSLTKIDKEILLPEFKKTNSNADEEIIEAQTQRFQRAGLVIAVLSTPVKHSFIPKWEMYLSSGAVCMNLLSCAQSLGYAAIWLTEWYAYNEKLLIHLGGRVEQDKVSGFIYIGHKKEEPLERKRPDPEKVIKHL
jgi:nitroreductase|tara:strand:- start:410 stop:979 length:570 start_codon:yes stop_codon:yes gene_type:complete